jgi:hypothetical protein
MGCEDPGIKLSFGEIGILYQAFDRKSLEIKLYIESWAEVFFFKHTQLLLPNFIVLDRVGYTDDEMKEIFQYFRDNMDSTIEETINDRLRDEPDQDLKQ